MVDKKKVFSFNVYLQPRETLVVLSILLHMTMDVDGGFLLPLISLFPNKVHNFSEILSPY